MKKTSDEPYKLETNLEYTLQEIANYYKIDIKTLHEFHNKHCKFSELLPLHLPQFVDIIYLPKEVYENKQKLLINSSKLELTKAKSSKTYGVIINFSPKNLEIHYETSIIRESSTVEINKKETFFNNRKADKILEQVYEKAGNTLYPLKLSLYPNGKIDSVLNTDEIQNRWKNHVKPDLEKYYTGKRTEEIISKCDSIFQNINSKNHFFQNNIFYNLFFLPIYQTYPDYTNNSKIHIYFSEIKNYISYGIIFQLSKEYTSDDKIVLHLHGSEEETFLNENRKKGEIDLEYKLDKNTSEIIWVIGYFSVYYNEKEIKIEYKMYELKKL